LTGIHWSLFPKAAVLAVYRGVIRALGFIFTAFGLALVGVSAALGH
jgi:hypothetical protein